MLPEIPRRSFLRGALATGALLAATRANAFALVNYRAEGLVVAAERLGDKLVIHNYGLGGAGITLSWGTASLAVDLARQALGARAPSPARVFRFAVLGCGLK